MLAALSFLRNRPAWSGGENRRLARSRNQPYGKNTIKKNMKAKVLEKIKNFYMDNTRGSHDKDSNEDEILEENYDEESKSSVVDKFYEYDPVSSQSVGDLLSTLENLVMEDSISTPIVSYKIVSEEKFMNILDTLRLKILDQKYGSPDEILKGASDEVKENYLINNDPEVKKAKEMSSKIKKMTDEYCKSKLDETSKILQDTINQVVDELEENKSEF